MQSLFRALILNQGHFCPTENIRPRLLTFLVATLRDATVIQWVEVREAAKHHATHDSPRLSCVYPHKTIQSKMPIVVQWKYTGLG